MLIYLMNLNYCELTMSFFFGIFINFNKVALTNISLQWAVFINTVTNVLVIVS